MSKSSLKINEYLCGPYNMTPLHSLLYFTIYKIIKIVGETLQTWLKRAILAEQISMNVYNFVHNCITNPMFLQHCMLILLITIHNYL